MTDAFGGGAYGYYLGVGGGIVQFLDAIMAPTEDTILLNHDRTDRNLPLLISPLCLREGKSHPFQIFVRFKPPAGSIR